MSGINVIDHFATINGLTIHYRDWGDPQLPPLVILHGGGNSISRSWDHVAAALADRFRVIVPDLRGNGESSWAAEYSWQLILDDALKLMDALGLSQVILCGHSLGGRVAYMLASQHPEYITRLVIVEAVPWDPKVQTDDPPIEIYTTIDDAVAEAYRRQPYANKDTLRHEVEHGLKQIEDGRWTWRMDPAFHIAALRGQLNPGTKLEWPALAKIECPTVLIYGVHSMGKMGTEVTRIAQTIPNCQSIEIPDAAHDLPNENPTEFIRALRRYLT
jgi:pimeloyl-ACP methyl ester carboxylesterase